MTDTALSEYTKGLRQFADLLDANPSLGLPMHGRDYSPIGFYLTGDEDAKKALANFARVMPGTVTKDADPQTFFILNGNLAGLHVRAIAYRDEVCERKVVGTHEQVIPATPAVEAMPERTAVIEDVEWVCGSILEKSEAAK